MLDFLIVLDRSGSMQDARKDHEGGLRSFVEDQRQLADEMRLTFVQFDTHDPCEIVFDRLPLADVKTDEIALLPRGGTPLLEAIGRSVAHMRKTLTPQDNVIVVIITDGEENSSQAEWTKARVKAVIDELEAANWKFLFLGANFDAFAEGGSLGVAPMAAMTYQATGQSVNAMYAGVSANTMKTRGAMRSSGGQLTNSGKAFMNFNAVQVKAMNTVDDADADAAAYNKTFADAMAKDATPTAAADDTDQKETK